MTKKLSVLLLKSNKTVAEIAKSFGVSEKIVRTRASTIRCYSKKIPFRRHDGSKTLRPVAACKRADIARLL